MSVTNQNFVVLAILLSLLVAHLHGLFCPPPPPSFSPKG